MAWIANFLRQPRKTSRILDVERNVMKPLQEAIRDRFFEEPIGKVLLKGLAGPLPKGRMVERGPGRSDDSQFTRKQAIVIKTVKGRQQHSPGKIARCAEHHESCDPIRHARAICRLRRRQRLKIPRPNRIHHARRGQLRPGVRHEIAENAGRPGYPAIPIERADELTAAIVRTPRFKNQDIVRAEPAAGPEIVTPQLLAASREQHVAVAV